MRRGTMAELREALALDAMVRNARATDRAWHRRSLGGRGRRFRGIGGGAGGVAPLLSFGDGTFTRSTEASLPLLFQPGDTITWHGQDVLRQSSLSTPDGLPYYAIEGSRVNLVPNSQAHNAVNYSNSGGVVITPDAGPLPDGEDGADDIAWNTGSIHQTGSFGVPDNTTVTGSQFSRGLPATINPVMGILCRDATQPSVALPTAEMWARTTLTANIGAGATTERMRATRQTVGDVLRLGGWQVEAAPFASSYIRTGEVVGTRAADDLTFAAAPATLNAAYTLRLRPSFLSSEMAASEIRTLLATAASSADRLVIRNDGGTIKVSVYDGGSVAVERALTFTTRGQEITLTLDPVAGSLTIAGATTGDGTTTTSAWAWDTASTLRVGAYVDGSNPYFGLVSEPVAA